MKSLLKCNLQVRQDDDKFTTYLNRAELYLLLNDYPRAKKDLDRAKKLAQSDAENESFNAINCRYQASKPADTHKPTVSCGR